MAVLIVDALEMIDVDHREYRRLRQAAASHGLAAVLDQRVHALVEGATVVEAGQAVAEHALDAGELVAVDAEQQLHIILVEDALLLGCIEHGVLAAAAGLVGAIPAETGGLVEPLLFALGVDTPLEQPALSGCGRKLAALAVGLQLPPGSALAAFEQLHPWPFAGIELFQEHLVQQFGLVDAYQRVEGLVLAGGRGLNAHCRSLIIVSSGASYFLASVLSTAWIKRSGLKGFWIQPLAPAARARFFTSCASSVVSIRIGTRA